MERIRVQILHNVVTDERGRPAGWEGWRAGHPMAEVFAYDFTCEQSADGVLRAAEAAFQLFNVGDDPTFGEPSEIAIAYRALGLRSLSVGDVVVVGDLGAVACASFGWDPVDRAHLPLEGEG